MLTHNRHVDFKICVRGHAAASLSLAVPFLLSVYGRHGAVIPVVACTVDSIDGHSLRAAGRRWRADSFAPPLGAIDKDVKVLAGRCDSFRGPEFHPPSRFDFKAVRQAYMEHLEGGRRRGGSTISQQTAKNVFLWPKSTWVRKGFEVYFTVLIELLWSKERIMEVYLNSIEMGNGIYGAEAVAQLHFGCTADELTRAQCALVAATLPNPRKYNSASPSRYMMKRQRQIMREMKHIPLFRSGK